MPVKVKTLTAIGATPAAVGTTILDEDFDEVLAGVETPYADTVLELQAQVAYKKHDRRESVMAGDLDAGDGHLCFTLEYLESVGLSPLVAGPKIKKGDRIVDIAGIETDYRIIEIRPQGHIRTTDTKPMLYLAFFEFPADQHARVV